MKYRPEDLTEMFLQSPVFATEKLDGTNVAKDDTGQLYSRRLKIGAEESHFQKTPLASVRSADITRFRASLCLAGGFEEASLSLCLVYGELMCNPQYYDYNHRGLSGQWRIFGSCLLIRPNLLEDVLESLTNRQFAAIKLNGDTIQILPCEALFGVALASGLQVSPVVASDKPLAQIVLENKNSMKKGELEGIILTIFSRKFGYNLLKWKGAHEPQTTALTKVTQAQRKLGSENEGAEEVRDMLEHMRDILADTTENVHLQQTGENVKKQHVRIIKKVKNPSVKYLSAEDRKIIVDGSYHSMKKFDFAENYERESYISLLAAEVRRHFIEEKNIPDDFTDSDNVIKFINATVGRITRETSFS
jgi:hypothetical protein